MTSKQKSKKQKTPRQELGIAVALRLGLPQICPLWNENDECKETRQTCRDCTLDLETAVDYRLCDVFSRWFWREVQKMELELAPTPMISSPEPTSSEGKEE